MADLFAELHDPAANLLPFDGILNDYGVVLAPDEAEAWLCRLLDEIPWRADEVVICGRRILTARQVAWYGDAAFGYGYSGATRIAQPWTALLLTIKARVEACIAALSPTRFNACLLNRYADGSQGMAWHSDDERELGPDTVIASLSLGARRKFAMRHKARGERREIALQHGHLIVMRGAMQRHWQHALMKSRRVHGPRVNLTFRTFMRLASK